MEALARAVEIHKALGHPVRLRILAMLRGGELCACQITAVLGLAPSTVSAHLADLKQAGLALERKNGRFVSYRLAGEVGLRPRLAPVLAELADDVEVAADARVVRELRRAGAEELCRVELDLSRLGIERRELTQPRAEPRRAR